MAFRFCYYLEIANLPNNMDFCLGAGNRGVKPCSVGNAALLYYHDNSWELATLSLVERDRIAKFHAVEHILGDVYLLSGIQSYDTKCLLVALKSAVC